MSNYYDERPLLQPGQSGATIVPGCFLSIPIRFLVDL
ncbi:hypothetical protein BN8_01594 [Fibrisoma limi BUZ 3]|uniref:Uncharacterized protein n=1 Tax=Fibrisoma limi BUZ 3 TaxID=1185876 RepID=I2GFA7_9BACT|nr:hypothetical protein BN8_01594 [Fibrisoma limi BUZ 3]